MSHVQALPLVHLPQCLQIDGPQNQITFGLILVQHQGLCLPIKVLKIKNRIFSSIVPDASFLCALCCRVANEREVLFLGN